MKKPSLIIAVLLFTAGLCWAAGHAMTGKAGSYVIALTFDKDRPVKGTNQIEIIVTDEASRRVGNLNVSIRYFMPSLDEKRPMMDYAAAAKPVENKYVATLNLTMKGEWEMVVSIVSLTGVKRTEITTFEFEVT